LQLNFDEKDLSEQLGFSFREEHGKILLVVKKGTPYYHRYASRLIEDEVLLDLENARRKLEQVGDYVVYSVYNLWKSVDFFKELYRKTGLLGDLTLLNQGFFSSHDGGELFFTYGHAHEAFLGELYMVLKNKCFLILSDRKSFQTFVIWLNEGDAFFIHPDYMHRMTVYKKDCLFLTLAPEKAGHDYLCVKANGFPVSLFYNAEKRRVEIKRNPKFTATYCVVKNVKKIDAVKLVRDDPEKLKQILENPENYLDFYFRG